MDLPPPRLKRRQFLLHGALLSLVGALAPSRFFTAARAASLAPPPTPGPAPGTFYARLNVKPVINAIGSVTYLGGSIMAAETLAAMDDASREFVVITELLEKSGEHLARLLGVDAAGRNRIEERAIESGTEIGRHFVGETADGKQRPAGIGSRHAFAISARRRSTPAP